MPALLADILLRDGEGTPRMLGLCVPITTYHDLSELQELRADWNRLADDRPFLSWEWLTSWWETYGGNQQLGVAACRDERQQVIGIAPWYISTSSLWPSIRFLGSGHVCTDYLQVLAAPDDRHAVHRMLADQLGWWTDRMQASAIEMEGVELNGPWHRSLCEFAETQGFAIQVEPLESSWRVDLPSSWEAFLQLMPSGSRRKARKAANRFENGSLRLCTSDPSDDLNRLWTTFRTLHERRRQSLGDVGCYRDPGFDSFIRTAIGRLAPHGKARFQWCETEGTTISIQLQLLGRDTVSMYQSGIDPEYMEWEPGHAMVGGAIRWAIDAGYRTYDFLRGNEPYKALWMANPVPLARLRLIPPRHAARLLDSVRSRASTVRRWAKSWWVGPRG